LFFFPYENTPLVVSQFNLQKQNYYININLKKNGISTKAVIFTNWAVITKLNTNRLNLLRFIIKIFFLKFDCKNLI